MKFGNRIGLFVILSCFLVGASFADLRFGGETSIGLVSGKLFATEQSQFLDPTLRTISSWRLSAFIGYDTSTDTSKFAVGFEQHLGIQLFSIGAIEHLPLIFSLPTRAYVRFGSDRLALDILAGIDNQFVVLGNGSYPAYSSYDLDWNTGWTTHNYKAAPSGYAMGLEIGLRLVIRHFYLTSIVALPISSDYIYPGMIRLGLGITY